MPSDISLKDNILQVECLFLEWLVKALLCGFGENELSGLLKSGKVNE